MRRAYPPGPTTVAKSGAPAGSVLRGCGYSNRGLRLRISQEQKSGCSGPVEGSFVILDVGDNIHSASLEALLLGSTDAAEVLGIVRREHPACVNVANGSILVVEEAVPSPASLFPHNG